MKKFAKSLLIVLLVISICGCDKKDTPTNATINYIEQLKKDAKDQIIDYLKEESSGILSNLTKQQVDFYKILGDFDYSVSNEKISDNKNNATVEVNFKTYDLGSMFANFLGEYISEALKIAFSGGTEEEANKIAEEIIGKCISDTKKAGKTISTTTTVQLVIKDDKWAVDENASRALLVNALTGGLIDSLKDIFSYK